MQLERSQDLARTGLVRSYAYGDDVRLREAIVYESGTTLFEIEAESSRSRSWEDATYF